MSHTLQVWDMRTKACIHTLSAHTNTVADVVTQAANPQVILHLQNQKPHSFSAKCISVLRLNSAPKISLILISGSIPSLVPKPLQVFFFSVFQVFLYYVM